MPPIYRLFMLLLLAVTMILTACGGAAPAAPSVADGAPTAPRVPPTTIPPTIVPNEAADPTAGSPSAIPSAQPTALGADCQMIKHVAGEAAVCGQPQKVVALGAQLLDVVVALGVQPVGYGGLLPTESKELLGADIPYTGDQVTGSIVNVGNALEPSLAILAELKPDLIVGVHNPDNPQFHAVLSTYAPTLLFNDQTTQDWKTNMQVIGQVLGHEAEAQQIIAAYDQRLAAERDALRPFVSQHGRLLVVSAALEQLDQNVYVDKPIDALSELLTDVGFEWLMPSDPNLVWDGKRTTLPPQSLSTLDPDTMIIVSATFAPSSLAPTRLAGTGQHHPYFDVNAVKTAWVQKPELRDMRACQEGRCYFVDYMLWLSIRGPLASHRILDELHTQLLTSKD